jgi:hypothetical protein
MKTLSLRYIRGAGFDILETDAGKTRVAVEGVGAIALGQFIAESSRRLGELASKVSIPPSSGQLLAIANAYMSQARKVI